MSITLGPLGTGGNHGFERFPAPVSRLRPDDGADTLPAARPSELAADLRLAGLRSLPEVSGAESFPGLLAGDARRAVALGDGGACAADQARRDSRHQRRVPAALS